MACQVQLMGVPHAADLSSGGNLSGRAAVAPRRLPPAKTTVKRALFGSPEPGSVTKMLNEEQQKNHQYVLQRYNFDIKTGTPAMHRTTHIADSSTSPLPTLIAQEIKDCEAKLNGEDIPNKCCKRSAQKICYKPDSSPVSSSRKNAVSSSERHKPYSAQSQLTDYYRVSKSAPIKGQTAMTANSLSIRHHQLEVLQMPSPQQVEAISSTHQVQDDDDDADDEQSSFMLPTMVSVQIVVKAASSGQAAVPVTASQQP